MPIYCLKCGYQLDHLTSNACPECGKEFDLTDPRTFRRGDRQRISILSVVLIALGAWFFTYGSYRCFLLVFVDSAIYTGANPDPTQRLLGVLLWAGVAISSLLLALMINHRLFVRRKDQEKSPPHSR